MRGWEACGAPGPAQLCFTGLPRCVCRLGPSPAPLPVQLLCLPGVDARLREGVGALQKEGALPCISSVVACSLPSAVDRGLLPPLPVQETDEEALGVREELASLAAAVRPVFFLLLMPAGVTEADVLMAHTRLSGPCLRAWPTPRNARGRGQVSPPGLCLRSPETNLLAEKPRCRVVGGRRSYGVLGWLVYSVGGSHLAVLKASSVLRDHSWNFSGGAICWARSNPISCLQGKGRSPSIISLAPVSCEVGI